jgi:isoleucyl-tRNA synthetase
VLDSKMQEQLEAMKELVLSEVNVKEMAFITDTHGLVNKKIKPLFPVLGKKVGGLMKEVAALIQALGQEDIYQMEREGKLILTHSSGIHELMPDEVEIISEDIPGWMVASEGRLTVALDVSLDEALLSEGLAREVVNRIQKIRKDSDFEVTDRIRVHITSSNLSALELLLAQHGSYIAAEVLAEELSLVPHLSDGISLDIEGESLHATVSVAN